MKTVTPRVGFFQALIEYKLDTKIKPIKWRIFASAIWEISISPAQGIQKPILLVQYMATGPGSQYLIDRMNCNTL